MNKFFAVLTAASLCSGAAFAASDTVYVTGTVTEFVEIEATQDTVTVALAAGGAVDMAGQEGNRALFTIRANTNWSLVATPAATFPDPRPTVTYEQVAYVNSTAGETIGGSIFIDPNPGVQAPGNNNLIRYSGTAGTISASGGPGTFNWGLGGAIDTAITPSEFDPDRFAAAGDYTAEIDLTVSVAP